MSECIIGTYISANRKGWGIIPYILFSSAKTDENIWFFFGLLSINSVSNMDLSFLPTTSNTTYISLGIILPQLVIIWFFTLDLSGKHMNTINVLSTIFLKFDDCTPKTFDKIDTGDGRDTGALYLYSPLLSLVKD